MDGINERRVKEREKGGEGRKRREGVLMLEGNELNSFPRDISKILSDCQNGRETENFKSQILLLIPTLFPPSIYFQDACSAIPSLLRVSSLLNIMPLSFLLPFFILFIFCLSSRNFFLNFDFSSGSSPLSSPFEILLLSPFSFQISVVDF